MAEKHGDSLDWYVVEAPLVELEKAFGVSKASFGMVLPEQWHSTHEKAMRLIDATDVDTIIEQHMKDNLLPLVGVLTVDNYMHFFKAGDGAKLVKLISKDAYAKDVIAPIVEEFRSVAAKFTALKIFFWVEPLQEYTMNQFGFDPEKTEKPLVGFLDQGTGQKYRMEGDFSATTLETFVKGVESGDIAAYSKSEGKNFKELVSDSDKAAFVKFYPLVRPLQEARARLGGSRGREDRGRDHRPLRRHGERLRRHADPGHGPGLPHAPVLPRGQG